MDVRLFYIDDSGAESTGFVSYSWVSVDIRYWSSSLAHWLAWRKQVSFSHRIPVLQELHATQFISGRQHISLDPSWNKNRALREKLASDALAVIATAEVTFGTVYRHTDERQRGYYRNKIEVYEQLVRLIDSNLTHLGDLGIVVMDGDGSDPTYVSAHRNLKLSTRSIIEDPVFQHSNQSQWVQMADLVAWSSYQHLLRHPGKQFCWNWYTTYLEGRDVLGGPRRV